jgi:hypothetical protein
MVVNDYACLLVEHGALESIASKLAPTKNALITDLLCAGVGASLLAMVVNDYACLLAERGALESIATEITPITDLLSAGVGALKTDLLCAG